MAAVGPKKAAVQHAQRAQQPCDQWQFKNDAHDEDEHQESVHVAVKRDLVGHQLAHMVVGQEAQRDGEDHKIAHSHPKEKHQATYQESRLYTSPLTRIEGWRDKCPQQV